MTFNLNWLTGTTIQRNISFKTICSNNKEYYVLHVQSNTTIFHLVVQYKYNYMFRPYMWHFFRLRFNLLSSHTRCVGCFLGCWELGGGRGGQDLVVFNSGYHDLGLLQLDYH